MAKSLKKSVKKSVKKSLKNKSRRTKNRFSRKVGKRRNGGGDGDGVVEGKISLNEKEININELIQEKNELEGLSDSDIKQQLKQKMSNPNNTDIEIQKGKYNKRIKDIIEEIEDLKADKPVRVKVDKIITPKPFTKKFKDEVYNHKTKEDTLANRFENLYRGLKTEY